MSASKGLNNRMSNSDDKTNTYATYVIKDNATKQIGQKYYPFVDDRETKTERSHSNIVHPGDQ
jgi:hypothetical protein